MMLPERAETHNIAELVAHPEKGEKVICRIPDALRRSLNAQAQQRALNSSGCELRFRLNSPTARIRIRAVETLASHHGGGLAQILFGDFSHTYFPVGMEECVYDLNAPEHSELLERASPNPLFHPKLVRLLLPTHAAISQLEIEGDIAPPEPGDIPQRRVLNYGSSITQGSGSLSSRESWAGRCAHLLKADLINLGFGGGCHCEPEMAEYLAKRNDFDFAILETGINMLGLDPSEADRRIEHLIRSFAQAHADIPTFCLGVFPCRNDVDTNYQGRAQEIRTLVRNLVADLASPKLHFIEGRDALDPAMGMTADLTHPSPAGMTSIGEFVAARIRKII